MGDSSSETEIFHTTGTQIFDRNPKPAAKLSIELRVPRREYCYIKGLTLKDVKSLWPISETGYKSKDQANLLSDLQRFSNQPCREERDYMIVTETYSQPKSGFPGRYYNSNGCQTLVRAVRSNVLKETADVDMNNGQPRCIVYTCKVFGFAAPQWNYYINNRPEVIRQIMEDDGVSKGKAKQRVIITLTDCKKLRTKSAFLKELDSEAKEIQKRLMAVPALQWILPFCKEDNKAGSFMSQLYHFIECKLLMCVRQMLVDEFDLDIAALVHDGLNITDKSNHDREDILKRARDICEEMAPGINMVWAWKELDFVLESNEKKPLTNTDGTEKELRVPESYETPAFVGEGVGGGDVASEEIRLDPIYEPTYEQLRNEFSLPDGIHGKVGCEYLEVVDDVETGRGKKLNVYSKDKFRTTMEELRYYKIVKGADGPEKKDFSFMDAWFKDPQMNARYLRDPSRKYKWDYFDMHPDPLKCPSNCYNLWRGFAAETMAPDVDLNDLEPDVKIGLDRVLGHISMLCKLDGPLHEKFILDFFAHLVQFPNVKFGVMCCLIGKQGLGKQHLWDAIHRMVGKHACFETIEPQRDVWGDNNDNMRNAFMVRIVESDDKMFAGHIGKVRNIITDPTIRVRSLYGSASNIASYIRVMADSNNRNSIPDSENERRILSVNCNPEKINDSKYFKELATSIQDDRVIRALYLLLKGREGVKERYTKDDIPVGEYGLELKKERRTPQEKFIVWLIERQTLGTNEVRFSDDTIYEQFKVWQEDGNEVKQSKASVLTWLRLSGFDIPGITKHRPRISLPGPQFSDMEVDKIQITEYIFNLKRLREHYKICNAEEVKETEIEIEEIEVFGVRGTWSSHRGPVHLTEAEEEEERPKVSGDCDSDNDYEVGRRAFNGGEGPPSPHPSNRAVKRGYDDAKEATTSGESQLNKRTRYTSVIPDATVEDGDAAVGEKGARDDELAS